MPVLKQEATGKAESDQLAETSVENRIDSSILTYTSCSLSIANNHNNSNNNGSLPGSQNAAKKMSTLSSSHSFNLACEVASLTSVYSSYSQFDFANGRSSSNRASPSPPPLTEPKILAAHSSSDNSSSLSSFLGLFGSNKKQEKQPQATTSKTFDMIASKFLSLKQKPTAQAESTSSQKKLAQSALVKQASLYSAFSSSSTSLNEKTNHQINNNTTTTSSTNNSSHESAAGSSASGLRSHFSSTSLAGGDPDLQVPSSVLIFENRPSNLPAKSQQEESKHRLEYEKMIEAAKRKEHREKEIKMKKYQQQIRKEDFMANSLRIWNAEILSNWNEQWVFFSNDKKKLLSII